MIRSKLLVASLVTLMFAVPALGQGPKGAKDKAPAPAIPGIGQLKFINGPAKVQLGTIAELDLPAGFQFLDQSQMRQYKTLIRELYNGNELGVVLPTNDNQEWALIFTFSDVGYVKDDEKDKLDASALLSNIKEGTKNANEERRKKGYETIQVVGWDQPPFYDEQSHNLTWALRGKVDGAPAGEGDILNYNSRILGRKGVMSANLILDPKDLTATLPTYKTLLTKFSYKSGEKYSEFRAGDKVAAYGLAALIGGGAVAVAAKTGLLGKFLKPIIAGIVVLFGAIGSFFKKIFGGGTQTE
jgi:uncharacterized membrane-anchored protein